MKKILKIFQKNIEIFQKNFENFRKNFIRKNHKGPPLCFFRNFSENFRPGGGVFLKILARMCGGGGTVPPLEHVCLGPTHFEGG